jgi:hypothetical protein
VRLRIELVFVARLALVLPRQGVDRLGPRAGLDRGFFRRAARGLVVTFVLGVGAALYVALPRGGIRQRGPGRRGRGLFRDWLSCGWLFYGWLPGTGHGGPRTDRSSRILPQAGVEDA